MNASARVSSALAIGAFLAGMTAAPALAQDKAAKAAKGVAKLMTVMENDKVKVMEIRYKPGDENNAVPSSASRVVYVVKGGTLTRMYADGKTEKVDFKTGDTKFNAPSQTTYSVKNTGKSDVQLHIVQLK